MAQFTCSECGVVFESRKPSGYCTRRCYNVMYSRTRDRAETRAKHQAWRDSKADERAALRLAAKEGRTCAECAGPIPAESRRSRKFCSRRCINQMSLREKSEERNLNHHKYMARKVAQTVGEFTAKDWVRLVNRHGGRCAYCGVKPESLVKEHVVPLSRGGAHSLGNILPACRPCNSSKTDKFISEWRRASSFRLAA